MKATELREKSVEELNTELLNLLREQFNLRMQDSTGNLENKGRFKEVRRTIARAKTLLNETPKAATKAAPKKAAKKAAKKKD